MTRADFAGVRRRVLELHAAGDYATALEVARAAAADFPEEAARTTYWIACLLSLLGVPDRGLETLEDGSRRGLWWAPQMLESDPDLEPLRAGDRFRASNQSPSGLIDPSGSGTGALLGRYSGSGMFRMNT